MHPYIIYIGLPVILVLAIVTFGFSKKFKDGKKVANSEFIQDTKYYKYKVFEFKACRLVMVISLALAMSFLLFILARPFKTSKTVKEIHNRDIFLCLDTSGSMYEVDLEVCEKLKDFVKGLKGERFGITIFNCQTVTLVPLTTDYDYVIDVLDQAVVAVVDTLLIAGLGALAHGIAVVGVGVFIGINGVVLGVFHSHLADPALIVIRGGIDVFLVFVPAA